VIDAAAASAEVVLGDLGLAVLARARDSGCRLIRAGTRGMGATTNRVFGSVATEVVHLSEVPVSLVH